MHLWSTRCQTDRNTTSRFTVDFLFFEYNGFLSYNGYIKDFVIFNGFKYFLSPDEDMKMSSGLSFGAPGSLTLVVVAQLLQ